VDTAASAPNRNAAFASALVDELARSGVRHACVCPGSRSAPLALAVAACDAMRCFVHVDERAAGFFALGLAKATRSPVALLCTSGTAAANFHPAVVEAFYARVPLVVLTANRPPELREWGAGQTIDQTHLYGSHVRWFAEAPTPAATGPRIRHARALACRAVQVAVGPPAGPVHLDLPFREPLDLRPVPEDGTSDLARREPLAAAGRPDRPWVGVRRGVTLPAPEHVASLAQRMAGCERGVVACGPVDATPDLALSAATLSRLLGWPLLAEPTSQLRCGPHVEAAPVVATADLLLRDECFASSHAPDFVLRLGDTPTSKALRLWLEARPPADLVIVDPDAAWNDPSHLASEVLRVDAAPLCGLLAEHLAGRSDLPRHSTWLRDFLEADRRATQVIGRRLETDETLLEARAVRELADALPDDALLYVSNSMPIRHLDAFLPASKRRLRVLCNRGANGIDGMVSSAAGAAAATDAPVVLLTGDLALVHDCSGLLAARRHDVRLTIVVLDNDGGGIFSFLPVADHAEKEAFEEHFVVPHGLDLGALCRGAGAAHARASSWEHFRTAFKEALAAPGLSVVEVPVDRDRNVAWFRAVVDEVRAAGRAGDAGGGA
jgi:2-succinyl-5-enolpyruvyl-6-hydroxy-3-cyclohexene-1-carboxylate synthase